MEFYGIGGHTLYVDLTEGTIRKEQVDPELVKKFLGGWGVGLVYAYEIFKPKSYPFASENPIIFSVGTLVGTNVPAAARMTAIFKSPLLSSDDEKHMIAYGSCSSRRLGWNLKGAGIDHIVITGKSERPVYLKIDDEDVELCPADDFWGKKDIYDTIDYFGEKMKGSGVCAIGSGGENTVYYAMALVDKVGTLGRHGLGAIMGDKKLKAIVARGTKGIKVADKKRLTKSVRKITERIKQSPWLDPFHQLGTHAGWSAYKQRLRMGVWSVDEYDKYYGIPGFLSVKRDSEACASCMLACRVGYKVKDGKYAGLETDTGHGVVHSMIGERLRLKDWRETIKFMDVCNREGLCAYATSGQIDWYTILFEQGKISEKETGIPLTRDIDCYLKLADIIIKHEGIGAFMALGWLYSGKKIGFDPRKTYPSASGGIQKGIAQMMDARFWGLNPSTFGGCINPRAHHGNLSSVLAGGNVTIAEVMEDMKEMGVSTDEFYRIFTPPDYYGLFNLGRMTKHIQDRGNAENAVGICDANSIPRFHPVQDLVECFYAATGIEMTAREYKKASERLTNLERMINVREGFTREDDNIPEAWYEPVMTPDGPAYMMDQFKTRIIARRDVQKAMDDYYEEQGWDLQTGIPTQEKLTELGLEDLVKDLPNKP